MSATDAKSFVLGSREHRAIVSGMVAGSPPGWVVTIKPPTRTAIQNARLHALIAEAVKGGIATDDGRRLDEEDAKTAFVSGWMIENGMASDIVAFNGRPVQLRRSTTTFTKDELSSLMDYIEAECALRGIPIKSRSDAATP